MLKMIYLIQFVFLKILSIKYVHMYVCKYAQVFEIVCFC